VDPHDDGVRAIVKYKTATLLKARKKEAKEAKKVARLQKKLEVWEKHAEMVSQHKEDMEWRLEKAMAEKEAREMYGKWFGCRERKEREQREMRMRKKE